MGGITKIFAEIQPKVNTMSKYSEEERNDLSTNLRNRLLRAGYWHKDHHHGQMGVPEHPELAAIAETRPDLPSNIAKLIVSFLPEGENRAVYVDQGGIFPLVTKFGRRRLKAAPAMSFKRRLGFAFHVTTTIICTMFVIISSFIDIPTTELTIPTHH